MDEGKEKTDIEIFEMLDRDHKKSLERAKIIEIATRIAINLASLFINQQDYNRSIDTSACVNYAGQIYWGIIKQDD